MHKISLAINSHNPKLDWLFEMLDSAIGFDETVIYCQGSPEATYTAIEQYIDDHSDRNIVLIVDNIERDIVAGFNLAVNATHGGWICSFCDDDKFIPEHLAELLNDIRQGKYDDADIIHFKVSVNGRASWGSSSFNLCDLQIANQLPHGSFFRRYIFNELDGYQIECCTDWDFWLRAMYHEYRFKYFSKPVYDFRLGHNSAFQKQQRKYGDMRATVNNHAKDYFCSRQV